MSSRIILLASAALFLTATSANAQQQPAPAPLDEEYEGEGETIVVTGQRPRGSVIGDIPPENVLDSRDVRATGATSIAELLEALSPQLGSARGRGGERPILLLNGQRISGFRELRDIPTEAIERVEILPEEVALRYGYRADQRVMNIVLRERFRSTAALAGVEVPTESGNLSGRTDLTRLLIGSGGRTTLNVHAEGNTMLTEAERDIEVAGGGPDAGEARSLVGSRRQVRATGTVNRTLRGNVGATLNGELLHQDGRSLNGLDALRQEPLERRTSSDSAHAGLALNWMGGGWRWSSTANADLSRSETESERSGQSQLQRTRTDTMSADADLTANRTLFSLPAGEVGTTLRVGASTLHLDGRRRDADEHLSTSLSRTVGRASVNLDLPVSSRRSDFNPLGNLTVNANGEVERLSDLGTLTTAGAGANWSPVDRLDFIASWTREEGAPSVQQLGDPVLETPGSRVFDFTREESVFATTITGGNPELSADRRRVLKLGSNWHPFGETLRLRGEFVRTRIDDPISGFPGATPELEAAFPDRFVRNDAGQLVSVDFRPVNFDSARRDTLRVGFDFSRPLRSAAPTQAQIEGFRARRRAAASGGAGERQGGEGAAGLPPGLQRRMGGGRDAGRLTFSLTDTINLVDEVTIRPGLPKLDYLGGDALGRTGGRARHEVEAHAGYFNNGIGARLSGNFRTATRIDSAPGGALRFSPLATVDLRLFANLGQRFELVSKYPALRGASVRLEIENLFDAKPKVRDARGEVPLSYQGDLLEPLGRTIGISFRKLFLPPRSFFRRQSEPARPGSPRP